MQLEFSEEPAIKTPDRRVVASTSLNFSLTITRSDLALSQFIYNILNIWCVVPLLKNRMFWHIVH